MERINICTSQSRHKATICAWVCVTRYNIFEPYITQCIYNSSNNTRYTLSSIFKRLCKILCITSKRTPLTRINSQGRQIRQDNSQTTCKKIIFYILNLTICNLHHTCTNTLHYSLSNLTYVRLITFRINIITYKPSNRLTYTSIRSPTSTETK